MNYIYGINAVAEALKARGRSFEWVGVLKERHDLRLQRVVEECRRNGVAVRFLGRPIRNSRRQAAAEPGFQPQIVLRTFWGPRTATGREPQPARGARERQARAALDV